MVLPLGDDEISLVRKKLNWKYSPFEIPENIMREWRKIGDKGEELEKKWLDNLNKKILKLKTEFTKIYINSDLKGLEKIILKKKKNILTLNLILQQDNVQSKTIESISKFSSSINWRIC